MEKYLPNSPPDNCPPPMKFSPETLETKLFPDWKPLMLCYIHQAQQTNICLRSKIKALVQGVKHNQSYQ